MQGSSNVSKQINFALATGLIISMAESVGDMSISADTALAISSIDLVTVLKFAIILFWGLKLYIQFNSLADSKKSRLHPALDLSLSVFCYFSLVAASQFLLSDTVYLRSLAVFFGLMTAWVILTLLFELLEVGETTKRGRVWLVPIRAFWILISLAGFGLAIIAQYRGEYPLWTILGGILFVGFLDALVSGTFSRQNLLVKSKLFQET